MPRNLLLNPVTYRYLPMRTCVTAAAGAILPLLVERRPKLQLHKVLSIGILAAGGLVLANVTTDVSGDPAYTSALGTLLDGTPWYPHTDEWAAIWFTRDPGCVPPDFDLLTITDFTPAFPGGPPRPFLCTSTVSGFAIWKNGPPPLDVIPLEAHEHGLGAVPVWFVRLSEIQAATADNKLTITELLAIRCAKGSPANSSWSNFLVC